MAQSQILVNDRILEILKSIEDIPKPNFKQLAREHGVPYQRLLVRSKGRPTRSERPSSTYKLTEAQDRALYDYIARLDELGVCVQLPMIVSCVNYLLQQAHDGPGPPPTASSRWAKQWLKRQPELHVRRQRSLNLNRALAHDSDSIVKWFDTFTSLIQTHGIPPMIIIEGDALLERYFTDLPDNYLIAHSDSGYTNDQLSVEWVKHFVQQSQKHIQGVYRLLSFDGLDSHCTQEFLEVLEDHKVIAYRLPPHTSHFLQPLDVGCFQPYKHWHAQAVDYATRTGSTAFNKVEFLAAIESIRAYTFKSRTIQKGWRDSGLYLLDIKRVKNNIQRDFADWYTDCQDTGSSSNDSSSNATIDGTPPPPELNTPLTIRTLKRIESATSKPA
ncbi:HTH-Tnp-Tc5 domain containing protein [Pyrenophora tritici-repentis]|uniref:HTH-Tnp-Tc5 domain containing protein n=1 Tax=Pyrenophora tritici-repentis TaxID=45151 RepID=A0A834RRZ7_9PLEO|nr:HTH-Tnp-Tc5 domain containing protein [Pyrenophora tritici-repentis]KAI1508459.1 transposase [Pyrenophora tritici-repentis]KAI1678803.1 transposase [Pyrenophora tritici-repentis]